MRVDRAPKRYPWWQLILLGFVGLIEALFRPIATMWHSERPLDRFGLAHLASVAGDTFVAVALAGSIFFEIPPSEAKGKVALYLALTMAPLALAGPLLVPLLDRAGPRRMISFGAALGRAIPQLGRPVSLTLPAVSHLAAEIEAATQAWPIRPRIVLGEAEKYAAFRKAHAALAASGTVTLELAISGVPMVMAYKVSWIEEQIGRLVSVPSFVLANLVLGEKVVPEFVQGDCTPEKLAAALLPLMRETPERRRQLAALARMEGLMEAGDDAPSDRAARIVCEVIEQKRRAAGAATA